MSRFGNTEYSQPGYATIKYGDAGIYGGQYFSKSYQAAGPFVSSIDITMTMALPITEINTQDVEVIYNGNWTHGTGITGPRGSTLDSTADTSGSLDIEFIGKHLTLGYATTSSGTTAIYTVYTDEATPQLVASGNIDMYSASTQYNQELNIELEGVVDKYVFTLAHGSGGGTIYFDYLDVQCTDMVVRTRASEDNETWTSWAVITNTSPTPLTTFAGTTINYNGYRYVQLQLELLTSVQDVDPTVYNYQLYTDEVGAYYSEGIWESNTLTLSPNFKSLSHMEWTSNEPSGTNIYIQTRAYVAAEWENYSNPYIQNDYVIHIKGDADNISWSVKTPTVIPQELDNSTFRWQDAHVSGYIPGPDGMLGSFNTPDTSNPMLRWHVEDASNNPVTTVDGGKIGDVLDLSGLADPYHTQALQVRAKLTRHPDGNSPYIQWHELQAWTIYDQPLQVNTGVWPNARISSVFEGGTGEKAIIDIPSFGFDVPTLVSGESYTINDATNRSIVSVYWEAGGTVTTTSTATVWASSTGTKHYQYDTGTAYYGTTLTIPMSNTFYPSIPSSPNYYAYRLSRGWSEDFENTNNEEITLQWDSGGETYEEAVMIDGATPVMYYPITETSIYNGDAENDKIVVNSLTEPSTQETEWVSDTFRYSGQVNANYLSYREDYNINVAIPTIDPVVVVGAIPYSINFVSGSIRTHIENLDDETGMERFMSDDTTPVSTLQIAPLESEVTVNSLDIVRGSEDADLIPYARITEIMTISNTSGGVANYTQGVDFAQDNSWIDWSIGGTAPTEGQTYYVTFKYISATQANVTASTPADPHAKHWVDTTSYWKSDILLKNYYDGQINTISVTCTPEDDYYSTAIPAPDDSTVWTDLPANTTTTHYVFNNNQLVSTYINEQESDDATPIEEYVVHGTLGGRRPSRYWNPRIKDGYYYLSKDEYFLHITPLTFVVPDDGIINIDTKTLEIPYTPLKNSPIIVTTMSNEATPQQIELRQVAFSREDDNRYVTYLTEQLVLDGTPEVRLLYYDIDPNFTITVQTEEGTNIEYIDTDTTDNIITLATQTEGATPVLEEMSAGDAYLLKDKTVYVTYQPKDCFVVEYNTLSGSSVRFTFSEHYDNLEIQSESTDIHPSYLALETDLNPIRTSMTSGFLYIASSIPTATYIDIHVYPDRLVANGTSRAVIAVDTIDKHGNPLVDNDITVTVNKGTVSKYPDNQESPSLRQMSGRTIYTYTAPASITNQTEEAEIRITDQISQLQRRHIITLVRED